MSSKDDELVGHRQAVQIIHALRSGKNCLEHVGAFSAGRTQILDGALRYMEELELTRGAMVRWVRGVTGMGKTHFFARLIEMAHQRNWVTSYVQIGEKGYSPELHRFDQVYCAIVNNCLTPEMVRSSKGHIGSGGVPGWDWLLEQWFERIRRLVAPSGGDVPSLRLQEEIGHAIVAIRRRWAMNPGFLAALHQYALAQVDADLDWVEIIKAWFKGEDVHSRGGEVAKRLRTAGIRGPITQRTSKEMLRSVSAFLESMGFGGLLVLVDEVENVLHQPASARLMAWTLLRELIDNVDDRQGMIRTAFYVSATPDVFDGRNGISEYAALADRVLLGGDATRNPLASVVDLAAWPLARADLLDVGRKIALLHSAAGRASVTDSSELERLLDESLSRNPDLTTRFWVKAVISFLDGVAAAVPPQ